MANNSRIALVTGANKGIGLEIARQLAQAGVAVIIGARDLKRGSAVAAELAWAGLPATFVPIDLNDFESIKAAAETDGSTRNAEMLRVPTLRPIAHFLFAALVEPNPC